MGWCGPWRGVRWGQGRHSWLPSEGKWGSGLPAQPRVMGAMCSPQAARATASITRPLLAMGLLPPLRAGGPGRMAAKQGDKSLRDMDKEGSSMFGGLPYLFAHLPIIHHLPTNSLPLHPSLSFGVDLVLCNRQRGRRRHNPILTSSIHVSTLLLKG